MTGSLRAIVVKLVIFTVFTLSVTGLLAAVIGNISPFTDHYDVKADFRDATGLLVNDVVRIAGVDVGKVTGAEVTTAALDDDDPGGLARVRMQIRTDVTLPENVRAAIKFRNLLGQRMVLLTDPDDGDRLPALPKDGEAQIPVSQTSPAFDLGVVFNNLRPVLRALDPEDANIVARATVQIFAGRQATVQTLVRDLADLSGSLGDRGPVITKLITELDRALADLAESDDELRSTLTSFDQLLGEIAQNSEQLGRAVTNVGSVSNDIADLLEGNRPELDEAISQLADVLAIVADHKADLDATLDALPDTTHGLNRATTYGEWANLFGVCINGICEQGFSSGGARDDGMSDIFGLAAEGGTS